MSAIPVRLTSIEGDGILDCFFDLLWTKVGVQSLSLRIPETVIFKYKQPYAWYFTSTDGTIKRKARANLTVGKISENFLKARSCEIVASFIYTSNGTVVTDHFCISRFSEFLHSRDIPDGVLQKFVKPNGARNHILHAFWSPQICIVEKYENFTSLEDKTKTVNEKAGTFEMHAVNAGPAPVHGLRAPAEVARMARLIVSHIFKVSLGRVQISRLAMVLKQDYKDRFVLLFVTSSRISNFQSPLEKSAKFCISKIPGSKCGMCMKSSAQDGVCADCFLKPAEEQKENNWDFLKGTQPLDPVKTKNRTEETRQKIIEKKWRKREEAKSAPVVKLKNFHVSHVQQRLRDTACSRRSLENLLSKYAQQNPSQLIGISGESDLDLKIPQISDNLRTSALTYMREIAKAI